MEDHCRNPCESSHGKSRAGEVRNDQEEHSGDLGDPLNLQREGNREVSMTQVFQFSPWVDGTKWVREALGMLVLHGRYPSSFEQMDSKMPLKTIQYNVL